MAQVLATLVYLVKDGKTLMLLRNKKTNDIHRDKYNGLGGKLEKGETPLECAIREAKEEAGIVITNVRLKGTLFFPKFDYKKRDWYVFVYRASNFDGTIQKESAEGDLVWVLNEKILELNLWDGDKVFLRYLYDDSLFDGRFFYKDGKLLSYDFNLC